MPQENNPDAKPVMSIPRCTWYLVFAMYIDVCLEACDCRAFVAGMTNRQGHWVYWIAVVLAGCRWVEKTVSNTASSSVEHVVQVTETKRRLFLVTSVTPISTLKIVYIV